MPEAARETYPQLAIRRQRQEAGARSRLRRLRLLRCLGFAQAMPEVVSQPEQVWTEVGQLGKDLGGGQVTGALPPALASLLPGVLGAFGQGGLGHPSNSNGGFLRPVRDTPRRPAYEKPGEDGGDASPAGACFSAICTIDEGAGLGIDLADLCQVY